MQSVKSVRQPRAHHYIPQCYLKGFSTRTKKASRLWVYEKGKEPRKSTPQNEAHIRDYYAFEQNGNVLFDFETFLGDVENSAASILRNLESSKFQLDDLRRDDRRSLSHFISMMFTRVPTCREFLKEMADRVMTKVAPAGEHKREEFFAEALKDDPTITEEEAESARRILVAAFEKRRDSRQFNLGMVMDFTAQLTPLIFELQWKLLRAPANEHFITSDNPLFTTGIADNGKHVYGVGFGRPDTQIYFPLNSNRCLLMTKTLPDNQDEEIIIPELVRNISEGTMLFAGRYVYAQNFSNDTADLFTKNGARIQYGTSAFVASDKQAS